MSEVDLKAIGKELAEVLETHTRFHVLAQEAYGFSYGLIVTDIERGQTVKIEIRRPL